MSTLVDYFAKAHQNRQAPLLLEYPDARVCGINPVVTLLVREGRLYKDDKEVGGALDLFSYLKSVTPVFGCHPVLDTGPQHTSVSIIEEVPWKARDDGECVVGTAQSPPFFPAWLGFFSYSFARYFDLKAQSNHHFPDAFFQYFTEGRIENHHENRDQPPSAYPPIPHHFSPDQHADTFKKSVAATQEKIRNGDVYQANLTFPFSIDADIHPIELYRRMREVNKSSHMGIVAHDDWWLLSGSPERLFFLHEGVIKTRPIAGTKKRGLTVSEDNALMDELKTCPKENAEHAMLVDLMRNDLNQVCSPGSVQVTEDRSVEFYSHVMHLVSEVQGQTDKPLLDIMRAIFPGGTITGAPKKASMETIYQFESTPREAYTGSLGYISNIGTDFNILIRSFFKKGDRGFTQAGAGIVIDSIEESEWMEVNKKAQFISAVLQGDRPQTKRRGNVTGPALCLKNQSAQRKSNVLFLENNDSFSFNIIDALHTLNTDVKVLNPDFEDYNISDYSHLVIGPGPGSPKTNPQIERMLARALAKNSMSILGICLGHQAIAEYFGSTIIRAPRAIHGERCEVIHQHQGLFENLPSPAPFARYHSLVVQQAPKEFVVDAFTNDDCIMAIRHTSRPIFGIQFHPESYLSKDGHLLLANFLNTRSFHG